MHSTNGGNSRLAGKAARNCAIGCARRAQTGRRPSQTPIGTQIRLAMIISTTTRSSVIIPRPTAVQTSLSDSASDANIATRQIASATSTSSTAIHPRRCLATVRRNVIHRGGHATAAVPPRNRSHHRPLAENFSSRVRRIRRSIHGSEAVAPAVVSNRNLADQATSGRNSNWS